MIVRSFRLESCCVVGGICSLMLLAGCRGGDFGSELAARPKPRSLSRGDGQTIRLPQDEPFSITLAPSRETPGLGGNAEADAHVSKAGSADAAAEVQNGGSAWAEFQLGHAFQNDSDRQMELQVRVRCEFETAADATPPSSLPDAKVGLKLYARDGRNRLVRNFNLAQHSTEEGAASSTDRKDIEFMLTLGPRERVDIFLAGSVGVETREGHSASGSIKLRGLDMELKTEMAPPVKKAGDEQG
ncbi:MAG: hypothetical protein ACE5I3_07780 [Phycisphaerae bacterium]